MSSEGDAPPESQSTPPSFEASMKTGLDALKANTYERAAEIFGEILQQRVKQHGELSEECALPGYYYGLSLLNMAQASQEVLVSTKEAAEDGNESSDLSVAWEALECARHNFELPGQTPNHSRLADVHVALGDVACEDSNFEAASKEYSSSLEHLNALKDGDVETSPSDRVGGIHRRYCEVYYKLCLASEFLEDPIKAAEHCAHAISSIALEIESVGEAASEMGLLDIEKDLKERKEVIEIAIKERDRVKEMLKQMLERSTPSEKSCEEPASVHLGVVGRGKQRLELTKIDEETESSIRKRASDVVNQSDEEQPSGKKTKTETRDPEANSHETHNQDEHSVTKYP